jgi:hypothetical protein
VAPARTAALCCVAVAVASAGAANAAAAVTAPSTFAGSCQFSGPITPKPGITVVPLPGPHFSYSGAGTCDGTLDAAPVTAAPLTVTFNDVATLFDTCELGPDFDLHGLMTIAPPGRRVLFEITVNLARLALAGPFALTTGGGGLGAGIAQFNPADAASAPQQCATTGVSAASLTASFNTLAPLVGTREAPPPPAPASAAAPPQPPARPVRSTAPSACSVSRTRVLHLHADPGRRVIAVAVYIDRRLLLRRHGRSLQWARLPPLSPGGHTIRIVSRLDRGGRRIDTRHYRVCVPR